MTKVTIYLAPPDILGSFISREGNLLAAFQRYSKGSSFETELVGEEAAEEAFDLTNNPGRQAEREQKYGRGRSVSSGDVIDVDGTKYACMAIGWKVFNG